MSPVSAAAARKLHSESVSAGLVAQQRHESVLVIAAHPDDETLGAGGTIARHIAEGDAVHLVIGTDGAAVRGVDHPRVPALKDEIAKWAQSPFGAPGWKNAHKAA